MEVSLSIWVIFNLVILALLSADLLYYHYFPHRSSLKEALITSFGWISLTLLFNLWIYYNYGKEPAITFLTGYLLEMSLSIDNLFVIMLIFSHFKVPQKARHPVLFYGILGAILMRAALIAGSLILVSHFKWVFYLFGVILIYSAIKLFFKKESEEIKHEENIIYRLLSKFIPLSNAYKGEAFIVKEKQGWVATPLLVVLLLIETTDLIFALDSVPAILGITTDPFLVYTSNICAILGLRSFFFVLENVMKQLYLLHYALALILFFIGFKMISSGYIHFSTPVTLGVIVTLISAAFIGSWLFPNKNS